MPQWEYLTRFVRSEATKEVKEFLQDQWPEMKKPPKYTPESMIPELNKLGAEGWELLHMEPVAGVGKKHDVRFEGGSSWSNTYFCVFKRQVNESAAAQTSAYDYEQYQQQYAEWYAAQEQYQQAQAALQSAPAQEPVATPPAEAPPAAEG